MSASREVALRAVAALFLERQHLARPRARRLTEPALVRWIADAGGLQLDSINVVERAHRLTTWSRFGPFPPEALDRIAYRRRRLFEYWSHAACLIARDDLPMWLRAMRDYPSSHPAWMRAMRRHADATREVLGAIRARGPLASADFAHPDGRGSKGWWSWKPATYVLNYLWFTGRLAVHSRRHFQKRYDLFERVFPDAAGVKPPTRAAFVRWHVAKSLHAMGAATDLDLSRYLTFPRIAPAERRAALAAMLRAGEAVELRVAGDRARWLALARDVEPLAAAGRRRAGSRGTTLLSPFDSFLWHRGRTRRLFGFDYRIEVYTPGPARVHGYYTLPILHEGQLIGRVDAKTHRDAAVLEARHVQLEPWLVRGAAPPAAAWGALDRDAALAGLADALRSLASHVGASQVRLGRTTPAAVRVPLDRALDAAVPRPARPRRPIPVAARAE